MKKVLMIDPPEGWKYGFPKPIPEDLHGEAVREWLVKHGYPQSEIDYFKEHFYCRHWYEEVKDDFDQD
jgi:hypothetical protein